MIHGKSDTENEKKQFCKLENQNRKNRKCEQGITKHAEHNNLQTQQNTVRIKSRT